MREPILSSTPRVRGLPAAARLTATQLGGSGTERPRAPKRSAAQPRRLFPRRIPHHRCGMHVCPSQMTDQPSLKASPGGRPSHLPDARLIDYDKTQTFGKKQGQLRGAPLFPYRASSQTRRYLVYHPFNDCDKAPTCGETLPKVATLSLATAHLLGRCVAHISKSPLGGSQAQNGDDDCPT